MPSRLLKSLKSKMQEVDYKRHTEGHEVVQSRCDQLFEMYMNLETELEKVAPAVDQLKGCSKGLSLAVEIVRQHKDIFKQQCKDEKISKEEFWEKAQIVDACAESVAQAANKNKEEFLRYAGKAEGLAEAASNIIKRIEENVQNLQRQNRFVEENEELFDTSDNSEETADGSN